jgi:adenylate kinase
MRMVDRYLAMRKAVQLEVVVVAAVFETPERAVRELVEMVQGHGALWE